MFKKVVVANACLLCFLSVCVSFAVVLFSPGYNFGPVMSTNVYTCKCVCSVPVFGTLYYILNMLAVCFGRPLLSKS